MRVGTKSLLFGVHCLAIHPWFVAWGWTKLYGFPFDPRIWAAFFLHDIGYWGMPNMDGQDGKNHVFAGAALMCRLFDRNPNRPHWYYRTLYHSRSVAKHFSARPSRLCMADKYATALVPRWLYLLLARLSGELAEYQQLAGISDPTTWHRFIRWNFLSYVSANWKGAAW